ncbi:GYF domain-containing protein [Cerasicoccus maritimus]|uniref:GYF domain-containing protein n=1 Tax=Cerasicoccus maritimus TaxID=490089 RepID=UPI002852C305|nr:GYF domain-containing protein [Cerasicoccus maritimus]
MSDSKEKIWYYAENGQQVGPFTTDEIMVFVQSGNISAETHVWKNGMDAWKPIQHVPELLDSQAPTPPPSPEDNAPASLKLGAGREFQSVNEADSDPNAGVQITDMLAATPEGMPAKHQEPRIVAQSKVGFFESFGLASFESAFFAVTLILGGIACAIMLKYWHAIVIGVSCLWMFVAGIALIVRAFMKHWGWGLAYLFIPFAALVYIVVDLKNAYKPVVLYIVGLAAFFTTIQSPSFQESPLFEYVEEYQQMIDEEIQKQQQEMEERRQERTKEFDQ